MFVLTSDERLTFYYLHETAPADAVIVTNQRVNQPVFVLSGLTGRAAYLEFANNPIDKWAKLLHPQDDRMKRIQELWTLHDPAIFRAVLRQTHATMLLEYADSPLAVEGGRPGLTQVCAVRTSSSLFIALTRSGDSSCICRLRLSNRIC